MIRSKAQIINIIASGFVLPPKAFHKTFMRYLRKREDVFIKECETYGFHLEPIRKNLYIVH